MSDYALDWAYSKDIPSEKKFVLVTLAHFHNRRTGRCDPSVATLAERLGKQTRQVRDDLSWLESHDLIRRAFRHRDDGSQRSSFYLLPLQGEEAPQRREGVQSSAPLELELELELEQDRTTSCGEQGEYEGQEHMNEGAYEGLWGSAEEREAKRIADECALAKMRQRRAKAQAKTAALALTPRSAWTVGNLSSYFRTKALNAGLPRSPVIRPSALNGALHELQMKGYGSEALATAIDRFFDEERVRVDWWVKVEEGEEIWKLFVRKVPKLASASATASAAPTTRREGWIW